MLKFMLPAVVRRRAKWDKQGRFTIQTTSEARASRAKFEADMAASNEGKAL
ncbi:MAG: hypothetical protein WCN98_11640 [Verrucomicrobiaceae bacterium]